MAKWMPHWFVVTLANGRAYGTWAKDRNGAESRWDEAVASVRRASKSEAAQLEVVKAKYMEMFPNDLADQYNRHSMEIVNVLAEAIE